MTNKKITLDEFNDHLNSLIGLSVSRPWLGYGSPVFLELGNLTSEPPRNFERGEFSINIDWGWRIECETKILFGSSNDRKEIQNGLDDIKNVKVKLIDISGAIPEISITFENGYVLSVRRHIICHRFRPGLRETLLTCFVDIKRRLCDIASVDVRLSFL